MSRKPENWYQLGYPEQRAWERQERERQDLEYERDQAREEMERSDRDRKRLKEDYRNEMASAQDQRDELAGELAEWKESARERWSFIKFKGLTEEFEVWRRGTKPMPTDPIIDDDDEGGG